MEFKGHESPGRGRPASTSAPKPHAFPPGFEDLLTFPLLEALTGRRARRFAVGDTIPDGPFAFTSREAPQPLSELERLLVLCACGGNTGWHYLIKFNERYLPRMPNYAGAAGGRTFPSGAGFHTSQLFFTDDSGTWFFDTRDSGALVDRDDDGGIDLQAWLDAHRGRMRRLSDQRLELPRNALHMEMHNTWSVNVPGSLMVIPAADLAQHVLLGLCYFVQNGLCVYDDLTGQPFDGLTRFSHVVDLDRAMPLSFFEQYCLSEVMVELGTSCYAGALTLQAMGLGGWMFDGLNPFSVLGASAAEGVPGLGFQFETDPRWPLPNPVGLPGVFEATCPPNHRDMRAAVEFVVRRKFGPGGPFDPATPGPFQESARVRASAMPFEGDAFECTVLIAEQIHQRFGRFPATVPSVQMQMYLQAHHLDLAFYDRHFGPGSYLPTHAGHEARWHPALH